MSKKDLIIFKPNELIEVISRPVSLIGLKAYNSILKKLQKENTDRMIISPTEILKEIGTTDSFKELYNYLDELQKVQVKSIDKRGKLWGSFVLISEFKKVDEGIFVQVPATIYNVLCGKDKKQEEQYYTTIKLLEEKSYKCSYSIIFYEIFKKYEKVELPIYTIEELRQMTETTNKYKVYADFKKRVIVPALKEISSFDSKYTYDFEEEYLGRKVYKIKFLRKEKTQQKDTEKKVKILPAISEKLQKVIEKARKNRYIQEKYSQRAVDKALEQFGEELLIKGLNELYKYNKPIIDFSKILTAKIEDLKRVEEVKKQGTNIHNVKEKPVKSEITGSDKLQNQEKTLDELKEMASAQGMKKIPSEKKIIFFQKLIEVKTKEELKNFCNEYDILLNLELF